MLLRLIFRANQRSLKYPLTRGEFVVGSAPECDIRLPHPTVSSRHARIRVRSQGAEIEDLGSRNGTLVNMRRVEAPTSIGPGAELTFGAVSGIVEAVDPGDLEPQILLDSTAAPGPQRSDGDARTGSLSAGGLEQFALEHLPVVLDFLLEGAGPLAVAQQLGNRLVQVLPLPRLEILHRCEEREAIWFSACALSGAPSPEPPVEVGRGPVLVRAWFSPPYLASTYTSLLESCARMISLADLKQPVPQARPRRVVQAPAALPNPPSVDPYVLEVYRQAARVARGEISVVIQGESGTGKELLARYMHECSAKEKFIALNCAALPRDLLELELFGIERAVATGVDARPGKFELAHGGTLFLDEIGDMGLETQAKILRVLQEQEVYRLGSDHPRPAQVRVIAATNRELDDMVRAGDFRRDLYHRIAAWVVELPPLRRRVDDIPNLAAHFLMREARRQGIRVAGITRSAMEELSAHSWPGNIRELRSAIARACLFLEEGEMIESQHLWRTLRRRMDGPPRTLKERLNRFERRQIQQALTTSGGDAEDAAARLGVSRATIYRRMKALGLHENGEA